MLRRSWFVPCLLLFGSFAGCVGAQSSGSADDVGDGPGIKSGPASFDESTGGIEGFVTDTELVPVPGALIGILHSETVTQDVTVLTDAAGRFSLSHVPPGSHVLQASALGYQSASKRIEVTVGQVTSVQLVVERLAVETARSFTNVYKLALDAYMYRLTPECMFLSDSLPPSGVGPIEDNRNRLKTCSGQRLGCDPSANCEVHFTEEFGMGKPWTAMVLEMTWQPQSTATGKSFMLDLNAPNITRGTGGSINQASPYTWFKMRGEAPITIRVDNPTTLVERGIPESDWYSWEDNEGCTAPDPANQGNCDWFYRVFGGYCDLSSIVGECGTTPVDVGISQGNTATVYFSGFYIDPAPAEFTALPDA